MSLLLIESPPKDCSQKGAVHLTKRNRKLLYTICTLLFSTLSVAILVWFILHPSKPEFYLRDTAVYELTLSSVPRLLNSTIQTTIVARNPNSRVGIYYDRLRAYAVYGGQQITEDSPLPPFYQGHQDSNFLSAALYGAGVAVAPSVAYEVTRDQTAGRLCVRLRLDGQLRWKVGSWLSGRYRFDVDCVAVVMPRPGDAVGAMSSMRGTQCSTSL